MQASAAGNSNPSNSSPALTTWSDFRSEDFNPSQPLCVDSAENAPEKQDSSATCQLRKRGIARLKKALQEQFSVFPSNSFSPLPVLKVVVKDLIQHIQGQIRTCEGVTESTRGGEAGRDNVEIYGGVARAIVAADVGEEVPATDFDVRFYIDTLNFDACRQFVEEYLLRQLNLVLPASYPQATDTTLVRFSYFQKQVVVGSCFSLLSFGNPATGKNVDIEFCPAPGRIRNYFDDANAFVIPLSHSVRWKRSSVVSAEARCLSGSFFDAVNLLLRRELVLQDPSSIYNGLTLYTHTLCVKRLTPPSINEELSYACCLAQSFVAESRGPAHRGADPLRLVRSFIRSHYAAEPLCAMALAAQLSVLVLAFGDVSPQDTRLLAPALAELFSAAACAALERSGSDPEVEAAVHAVARFAASPGASSALAAADRSIEVPVPGSGRALRLLRLPRVDVDTSAVVAGAAALLEERWRFSMVSAQAAAAIPPQCPVTPGLPNLIQVLKDAPAVAVGAGAAAAASLPAEHGKEAGVGSQGGAGAREERGHAGEPLGPAVARGADALEDGGCAAAAEGGAAPAAHAEASASGPAKAGEGTAGAAQRHPTPPVPRVFEQAEGLPPASESHCSSDPENPELGATPRPAGRAGRWRGKGRRNKAAAAAQSGGKPEGAGSGRAGPREDNAQASGGGTGASRRKQRREGRG